jgi:hypothetical protein
MHFATSLCNIEVSNNDAHMTRLFFLITHNLLNGELRVESTKIYENIPLIAKKYCNLFSL